jgi:hypothetical protein
MRGLILRFYYLAAIGVASLAAAACTQQLVVDDRLVGSWTKIKTGHHIEFEINGGVSITVQRGNLQVLGEGRGSFDSRFDSFSNLKIMTATFGRCGFIYNFHAKDVFNLVKTTGPDTCDELSGVYTRDSS